MRILLLALATLALSAPAAQAAGAVTEPIKRDERVWCMGLAPYESGFEKIEASELLRRYPACFAGPLGCERPNYGAKRNLLEAETRAYVACKEMRPIGVDAASQPSKSLPTASFPIRRPAPILVPYCKEPSDWDRQIEGDWQALQNYAQCLRDALDQVQSDLVRRGLD
jgi:hypothetical protein